MRHVMRFVFSAVLVAAGLAGASTLLAPNMHAAPGGGGGQFCGGIAGIPCPEGFVCVDKPGDGCNPKTGGADCAGVCRKR